MSKRGRIGCVPIFALLLLLAAGCDGGAPRSQATLATVPPNAGWLACTADPMCTAVWLSCHGWLAINGSHEADVQGWYRKENADFLSRAECDGPPPSRSGAVCRSGSCALK
jgi:hypothetical protein